MTLFQPVVPGRPRPARPQSLTVRSKLPGLTGLLCGVLCAAPGTGHVAHAAPPGPAKYALLVGINKYPIEGDRLSGCVNDVKSMARSLHDNFGFDHIVTLTDAQATHKAIIAHFKSDLINQAKAHHDAVVLFYYSGHGSQLPDQPAGQPGHDEADGEDEAICPVDVDGPNGSHNDILDDELNALYKDLARYTTNATFIFDSCHSGTVTRAPSGSRGPRIKERRPRDHGKVAAPAKVPDSLAGQNDDDLPRAGNWVALAGCEPTEESVDDDFPNGPHGALTFFLLQAMQRATRRTSSGKIWQEVSRGVSSRYADQDPVLEGKSSVPFLGGATKSVAPPYLYRVENHQIVIGCGSNQGAKVGGFVALQPAGKPPVHLAIKQVGADRSYAEWPAESVPASGTAELLTPYFGIEPVRVRLDLSADSPVGTELRRELQSRDNPVELVHLVGNDEPAELTIHYGPQSTLNLAASGTDAQKPVYCVLQGDKVLYDQLFDNAPDLLTKEPSAPYKLREELENYVQQRNLKTLSNPTSELLNKVTATFWRVPGQVQGTGDDANFIPDPGKPKTPLSSNNGTSTLPMGAGFEIRLHNTTDHKLYTAVAAIGTDGAITLLPTAADPDNTTLVLPRHGDAVTAIAFTTPPGGVDTYKVLVSTTQTDWTWLQREAVRGKGERGEGGPHTPFEAFLAQTAGVRGVKVRVARRQALDFNAWATQDFKLQVGI